MQGLEVEKHLSEVKSYIEKECEWPPHEESLQEFRQRVLSGFAPDLPGMQGPLASVVLHHLGNRINNPVRYALLPVYLDQVLSESYLPAVAFFDEARDYVLFSNRYGPSLLSEEDSVRLDFQRFHMWGAREVATGHVPLTCPVCQLANRREVCNGCVYSEWFTRTWGFELNGQWVD
jgi:hypothetical protein